ncbi:MAG TPA: hypothetical protein DDX85_02515 [Nitrospiraceae bacterium]|nr:hypothetical protein [Nitrospiraceae bacterium]
MKKFSKIIFLLSTLFILYGCAEILLVGIGAGAGVTSYMYVDGRVAVEYPIDYDRAWNSTRRALDNFQISISSSTNENGVGMFDAVRKDGKKVSVKLVKKVNDITVIAIRVGTLGDKLEAQKLHNEIVAIAGI